MHQMSKTNTKDFILCERIPYIHVANRMGQSSHGVTEQRIRQTSQTQHIQE